MNPNVLLQPGGLRVKKQASSKGPVANRSGAISHHGFINQNLQPLNRNRAPLGPTAAIRSKSLKKNTIQTAGKQTAQ